MTIHRLLLALLCVLATAASAAAPTPYVAEYEVLRNGSELGRAEVTLRRLDDGDWELLSHTRGTRGLAAIAGIEIRERSQFRVVDGGFETTGYEYRQRGLGSRERSLRVDRANKRIHSADRDRRYELEWRPGTLDRQIVTLAIGDDLAGGASGELAYRVADREEAEEQRYRVAGTESVDVPAGKVEAVRVERLRSDPGRTTTSWLDPRRGYLPVRMVQREAKGDTIEMRLIALRR